MKDPVDEMLRRFEEEVLPQIDGSAMTLVLMHSPPDAKICLEVGAAILLDKPLLVFAAPGTNIPQKLRNLATAIVVGEMSDPSTKERLTAAIAELLRKPLKV